MDIFYWALVVVAAVVALYIGTYIASGAFFDRKIEYNKRLLRQLEERKNAEEKDE